MYYLPTSCLFLFFLFILFHSLLCASSKKELGWCEAKFQCGSITAGFPFSGLSRPQVCGHPLLELNCYKNTTSLIISNHLYNVLQIDQTSKTLRISRAELQGSFCKATFTATTTLPPGIFELSSSYKSLNVFYLCDPKLSYQSCYTCPGRDLVSVSQNLDYHKSCQGVFTISVPKSFVPEEKELNLTHLESTLSKGFEVKVKIDDKACQKCSSSGGTCGFENSTQICCKEASSSSCYKIHPPDGGKKSTKANTGIIAAAVSISALALIVACVFLLIRRRRKTQEAHYTSKDYDVKPQNLMDLIPLKHYSYAQVQRITKSFAEVVGKGGFGTVYRGTLSDGRSVAVKILKDSKGNGEDFINEVASMSKTSHVNIVTLLGFCSEGSKRAILYEFVENGSLDSFISRETTINIDMMALYSIALGIARGLEYLHHGCKTRIVHFDIKPQNILLDDNFCPKVSDFGLAKLCEKKESTMSLANTRGTIGYIAPELFSRMYGRVSHKSDVYSYGMLLLEMIGARNRERAEQSSSSNTSSIYFPGWIYKDLEKANTRRLTEDGNSTEEEEVVKKMTLVGLWCIQPSPSDRPAMNRVIEMMEGNLDALEVPPRPVFQISAAPLQESSTLSEDISIYTEVYRRNLFGTY